MASGGGGKSTQTRYGRGASTPTQAQQAASKASAAKALAARQAAIAEARAAQLKALEAAMGGRPAWVAEYNTANKGSSVIYPTLDTNNSVVYRTNSGETYNPSGQFLYKPADNGGFFDMLGDALRSADPLKLVGDAVGDIVRTVGSGVEAGLKNPLTQVALSIALPGIGNAITSQLVSSGVMAAGTAANAVGMGIANAAVNIASGQDPEAAIKNALVSTGLNIATPSVAKAVKDVVGSPAITNTIVNAGNAAIKTAAAGGDENAIANALAGSLASSGATAAINTAVTNVDPTTAKVLGATISGAINNGPEGAIKGAVNTLATEAGKNLISPTPEKTDADNIAALGKDQITVAGVFEMPDGTYRDNFGNVVDERGNPIEGQPFRVEVAGGEPPPEGESVGTSSTAEEEQADREQAARDAIRASEKTIADTLTDSGLVTTDPAFAPVSSTGNALSKDNAPVTGNTITDSSLPVNPNVGGDTTKPIDQVLTDAGLVTDGGYLEPVTIIGKPSIDDLDVERNPYDTQKTDAGLVTDGGYLDPVYITAKRDDLIPLEEAKPLPDNTVKEVIADTPKDKTEPKIPIVVKPAPVTPTPKTPVTPTPKTPVTPAQQFYQTTTQSNPTTLADIKYYLDMTGTDILPPKTSRDPLESLLNQSSQPMSLDDLLYHLRS